MSYDDRQQWSGSYVRIPFGQGWSGPDRDASPQEWRRTDAVPSRNWGGHDVPGRTGSDAPLASPRWGGQDIPGRRR